MNRILEGAEPILPLPKPKRITRKYLPHVDRDHRRGREVAGPLFNAGALSISLAEWPKYRGDQHTPPYHRVGLILQGRIRFRCGEKTLTARPGELVFTPAGTPLQRTGIGPVAWLFINLEDIPMWKPLMKIGFYVRKYESADLMYIHGMRILGALRTLDIYSMDCARESAAIMANLLKREFRQSKNAWPSKQMGRYVMILDRIRERPDLNWDRTAMAHELNMSERTLTREFQSIFNMPPSRMVMSIRMDLASRMLIDTERSIADIASFVGYESPFSFSRLFKKCVGVSPERYRTMPVAERQKTNLHIA